MVDNSLKQFKTSNANNSLWVYVREGLLPEGYLRLEIWAGAHYHGLLIWVTFVQEGLFSGGLIIGILLYVLLCRSIA